jgi:hypothetical protein
MSRRRSRIVVSVAELVKQIHDAIGGSHVMDGVDLPRLVITPASPAHGQANWRVDRVIAPRDWYTGSRQSMLNAAITAAHLCYDVDWETEEKRGEPEPT